MLFQVYFETSVSSSELGFLPEYCAALNSLLNGNEKTTTINAGLGNTVFAHGSHSVPSPFRIPFILPVNSALQGELNNQLPGHMLETLRGYTIAGIIIQGEVQVGSI